MVLITWFPVTKEIQGKCFHCL